MTYDANKLMHIVGAILTMIMLCGIFVLVLYVLMFDERDPRICLNKGGIPVMFEGCIMEEEK